MGLEPFSDRRRALEEAFFAKRDAEKLAALRQKIAEEAAAAELAAASGIENPEVLQKLRELDIGADTLVALALVPLVEVAWADGTVDEKEQAAVLQAAVTEGMRKEGPAYGLLTSWLESRPGPELRAAWFEYVRALCATLSPDARRDLQANIMGRAASVAEATGGFLGFGNRVSPVEREVLEDLQAAFEA